MDIYAKEVSKMQSVSKSSAVSKKRNFDAAQFNTYGLPLGEYDSQGSQGHSYHIYIFILDTLLHTCVDHLHTYMKITTARVEMYKYL